MSPTDLMKISGNLTSKIKSEEFQSISFCTIATSEVSSLFICSNVYNFFFSLFGKHYKHSIKINFCKI